MATHKTFNFLFSLDSTPLAEALNDRVIVTQRRLAEATWSLDKGLML